MLQSLKLFAGMAFWLSLLMGCSLLSVTMYFVAYHVIPARKRPE